MKTAERPAVVSHSWWRGYAPRWYMVAVLVMVASPLLPLPEVLFVIAIYVGLPAMIGFYLWRRRSRRTGV